VPCSPYDGSMAQQHRDSSGTPLPTKLGIREGAWIHVDAVRWFGLDTGLVDDRSASITETFQRPQFVVRVKDRAR
jgi:hypothetical protein